MKKIKLSVVIPVYNESKNFRAGVLDSLVKFTKSQKYAIEVIFVDDGSTDETPKLLKKFVKKHSGFKVLNILHGGKVIAVTNGINQAKGEIVVFSDFDQSTPISEITKFLEEFETGADVAIGERIKKTGWSFFQNLRSKVFNLLTQIIVLPGIKDTQCGFKAFKNNVAKDLFSNLKVTKHTAKDGYKGAFDVELLFLARRKGYRIASIPVEWNYIESSRLSPLEPIKMLRDITTLRLSYLSPHVIPLVLLFLLTIPSWTNTAKVGYFAMHDDLQFARQIVMDKCFDDGQIPCRWSQELGYGYGYPIFNYYPPFPYYAGQVFRSMGFAYIDVIKIMVILNFVLSGFLMYLLAQSFWGRWGGLLSGLLFVYAPYHAVDIYARGAMNEAWAITFFPGVFWALFKLIEKNKWKYVFHLSLFSALVMLSHNLMLMLFAPVAAGWALFWLFKFKNFKVMPKLISSGVWAFGLAAFFTIPVIFEQKYAHVETLIIGYFNYLAHFANLEQLFISRFWGYEDSRYGPIDGMSFQIGHIHWILSALGLLVAFLFAKKKPHFSLMILLTVLASLFYAFLAHERSSFIWSIFTPIQFLQFPWRTLSIVIFGTSFIGGSIVFLAPNLERKVKTVGFLAIVLLTLALYKDYFQWKSYWPWVTDQVKLSGELWKLQTTAGIFDYLPIWAPLPPANPPNGDAEIIEGEGEVKTLFKNSIKQGYDAKVSSEAIFQINTYYFPGWKYFVNNKEVFINPEDDPELGRPQIKLSTGQNTVVAKFTRTTIRLLGDTISLFAWVIFLIWLARISFVNLAKLKAS